MKRLSIALLLLCNVLLGSAQTIVNGIPWYDQNREPVSAHGANIIKDGNRYYLFGEYKTDSANVFTGFSCYSSSDLARWRFEGIAFSQQQDGRMGPARVGERPKVLRCPKTGEYVMLMHTDNLPIEARDGVLSIPEYREQWNPLTGHPAAIDGKTVGKQWKSARVGDTFIYKYKGTQVGLLGNTDDESGYADISIKDKAGKVVFQTSVDFYSKVPAKGLRWLSPHLPKARYTLEVKVSEMKPNWTDKTRTQYGSKGHKVEITDVVVGQSELFPDGTTPVTAWSSPCMTSM